MVAIGSWWVESESQAEVELIGGGGGLLEGCWRAVGSVMERSDLGPRAG